MAFRNSDLITVVISRINNPSDFYVLPCDKKTIVQDTSALIKNWMTSNCATLPNFDINKKLSENNLVTFDEKLGLFFRVCILQERSECPYVFYVDDGKTEKLSLSKIKYLDHSICGLLPEPSLINCRLSECYPEWYGDRYHDALAKATKAMVNLTGGNVLFMKILNANGMKMECDLYLDNVSIARTMSLMGYTQFMTPVEPLKFVRAKIQYFIPQELDVGVDRNVIVTQFNHTDLFYISKSSTIAQFSQLTNNLKAAYDTMCTPKNFSFIIEHACVACPIVMKSGERSWRRGLVKKVFHKYMLADIYLVDMGISLEVEFANIKLLEPKFLQIEAKATHCKLTSDCHLTLVEIEKLKGGLTKGSVKPLTKAVTVFDVVTVKLRI